MNASAQPLVLIVDDNEIGREILAAGFEQESMKLEMASDGEEALRKARLLRPDVILLDVMMPGIDGFEVCRRLRGEGPLAEVPILLVTSLDDRDSRLKGIAVGADDFITRPFDMLELGARVRSICRLNRYRKIVEERARVGQLFEFAPHGVLLLDQELLILAANPAVEKLLRVAGSELLGRPMLDWVAESQRPDCRRFLAQAFEALDPMGHFETAMSTDVGETRLVDLSVAPCPWEGRTALQVFFRDVTEKRRAAEAAERLHRLDAVASSAFEIVHKFNNYLSVINLNAELLDDKSESAAAIVESCEQAAELSDQILAWARRDLSGTLTEVDIDALLEELVPSLASLIGSQYRVQLRTGAGAMAKAHPEQLRAVLLSLVMNARDAMEDGGVISICTDLRGDAIVIEVEDTGVGVSEAARDSIFEPFFTTKEDKGSNGLGLSAAAGWVDKWGGRIEFESSPGDGAVFSVVVPVFGESAAG